MCTNDTTIPKPINAPRLPATAESVELMCAKMEEVVEAERTLLQQEGLKIIGNEVYLNQANVTIKQVKGWLTEYIKMRDVALAEKVKKEKAIQELKKRGLV